MSKPPRRRLDDSNIAEYALKLYLGQTVNRFIRSICFAIAVALGFMGYGPLINPNSPAYRNPVFDGVFTAAKPWMWGTMFWIAAALMLFVAISGRALVYLLGLIISAGTMIAWTVGVVAQAIVSDQAHLTEGAVGLYIFTFTAIFGLAAAPRPMEVQAEIFERTEDGKLIPIERIERRAG